MSEDYKARAIRGCSISLKEVNEHQKEIEADGLWHDRLFLLPADTKERMQMLGNLFVGMMRNLYSCPYSSAVPMNDAMRIELKSLATTLSYLMNSSSFRDGVLHDFDRLEIDTRLKRVRKKSI